VAIWYDGPEAPDDLIDLGRVENRDCLAQTPTAIDLTWVGSEARLDAIDVVHVRIIGANRPRD
jgi:hypothetical protein